MQECCQKRTGGIYDVVKIQTEKFLLTFCCAYLHDECSIPFLLLFHFSSSFGKSFTDYLGHAADG